VVCIPTNSFLRCVTPTQPNSPNPLPSPPNLSFSHFPLLASISPALFALQAILEQHDVPKLLISVMDSVNAADSGPMMNIFFRLLLADDSKRTESFVHQYIKVQDFPVSSLVTCSTDDITTSAQHGDFLMHAGWGTAVPLFAEAPAGEQPFCGAGEDAAHHQPDGPHCTRGQQDVGGELRTHSQGRYLQCSASSFHSHGPWSANAAMQPGWCDTRHVLQHARDLCLEHSTVIVC
jgi:hypothetical protein